jgi:hypothetical protein
MLTKFVSSCTWRDKKAAGSDDDDDDERRKYARISDIDWQVSSRLHGVTFQKPVD